MKKLLFMFLLIASLAALGASVPDARSAVKNFLKEQGNRWSIHFSDHQTIHSLYGTGAKVYGIPEQAADDLIDKHAALFGIDRTEDLRLRPGAEIPDVEAEVGVPTVELRTGSPRLAAPEEVDGPSNGIW